jgi:hypothetical protein
LIQSTYQADGLGDSKRSDGSSGQDHRGERSQGDDNDPGKNGPSEIEELVLLSGGSDVGERSDDSDGVQSGSSEQGGRQEQQRSDGDSLSDREEPKEGELLDRV